MEFPKMLKFIASVLLLHTALTTYALAEPFVIHAGEWETTVDAGQPKIICRTSDVTFDKDYVMKSMSKVDGVTDCKMSDTKTVGNVTSYLLQCTVGDDQMTSSGSITVTGPDAYTGMSETHGGAIKMPNGRVIAMPDTKSTSISRRLGPCKPGDREVGGPRNGWV
jgi:hypothetical protein